MAYFGQDNSVIKTSALRTTVGVKKKLKDSLLCYCLGISFSDAEKKPEIKQFVTEKTKYNECAGNMFFLKFSFLVLEHAQGNEPEN